MKVSDFDFILPTELIAEKPVEHRDESKLLILNRQTGRIDHAQFRDLTKSLNKNDVLVFNNTKVFPARIIGWKEDTGGKVEILLNHQNDDGHWEVIGKNLKVGSQVTFHDSLLRGTVLERSDETALIAFNLEGDLFFQEIDKIGHVPLPPYIESKRRANHTLYENDKVRYQTIYAKETGSVAAPTAGLHFTNGLLGELEKIGLQTFELTLHVGLGTFAPVKTTEVEKHQIHKEAYSIEQDTFNTLLKLKREGRRIIAVGTTTTRVLESIFQDYPNIRSLESDLAGWTNIYIYPGYQFKFIDGLITNFHLPKSSLLFLISAFAGTAKVQTAYQEAIRQKYRFYSYGDAMLII